MNELTTEKTMTTKEVAEALNTSSKVILENAKKCLPNKRIENGKATYWTQAEVTVLLDCLKNNSKTNASDLYFQSKGSVSTELTPALMIKQAMELMQKGYQLELERIKAENERHKAKIAEDAPKVDFYDRVTESSDCIDIGQCAKVLNVHRIGRNKLFEILRQKKILNEHNQPYQKYVDCGYFRIIETSFNLSDGTQKINLKTVVFQRGVDFIRKMIEV